MTHRNCTGRLDNYAQCTGCGADIGNALPPELSGGVCTGFIAVHAVITPTPNGGGNPPYGGVNNTEFGTGIAKRGAAA